MHARFRRPLAAALAAAPALTILSGAALAGPKAYIGNFADNTVSVIDTLADRVGEFYRGRQGAERRGVLGGWQAPARAVYGEDRIAFIDAASRAITATTPVPKPHIISTRPGGKEAYVTSQEPGHFALAAISGDGKTACITNEGSNDVTMVDLAIGKTAAAAIGKAPLKIVVQASARTAANAPATVSIASFAFAPPALAAAVGDNISWRNDDGRLHTVTFKDGSPGARSLAPGEGFARIFDMPGRYEYFCSFHPYMTGI